MDNFVPKLLVIGGACIVFLIVLMIVGFSLFSKSLSKEVLAQDANGNVAQTAQSVEANEPITINKIVSKPVVYKDSSLTVDGEIVGWVTKNAVIINQGGEKNKKKNLLVIRNEAFGLPSEIPASEVALGETVSVSVTGTVGILNIKKGDTTFGDEASVRELQKWNKLPVVFATSVTQK